ncbi:hypothetical protein DL93DRAFT_2167349 [Clavulina sp. PMI_390]|nr:hypothetical protein DL93DRAFT_2167349 [Clavulina sp. PMI_390]
MPVDLISRLPPELLIQVFEEFLVESSTFRVLTPLLCITSVCAHWRSVAIASPALWTRVYYGPRSTPYGRMPAPDIHEWAVIFLERSRSAPLEVFLESTFWDPAANNGPAREEKKQLWWKAFDLLVPHLHRCHDLTIRTMHVDARRLWGSLRSIEFKLLKHFSFQDVDEDQSSPPYTWFTAATSNINDFRLTCGSLKYLQITSRNPQTLQPIPIAGSLRYLHLVVFTMGQWWDNVILSLGELPALHHLSVMFTGPELSFRWDMERRAELPNLESLETNFPLFSVNLRTPRLAELMLRGLSLDRWSEITRTEAYRRHRWPHPALHSNMSGIQSLSRFTLTDCEIEWVGIGPYSAIQMTDGGEILTKMMASMGEIPVDTLEFIGCDGIEGTLRRLASPTNSVNARMGGGAGGTSHNDADVYATRNPPYLLPNLQRLVVTPNLSPLEDSVAEAVAELSRGRPTLTIEQGKRMVWYEGHDI